MDATPINNRSVLPRTTVTLSQNSPGCICLWALPSPCCQRFDHLFVWILPFDLPGLVRPARSWSLRQYSSQGWSHKPHRQIRLMTLKAAWRYKDNMTLKTAWGLLCVLCFLGEKARTLKSNKNRNEILDCLQNDQGSLLTRHAMN